MLGCRREELTALSVEDIHPSEALPRVINEFGRQLRGEVHTAAELPVKRRDGSVFFADITSSPMILGGQTFMVGVFHDITERKKLEEQLRQSQKMEAVGHLAGGIAHDFNNLLSAVIGYGHLLRDEIAFDDPRRLHLEQILDAADRAATLTHSLLAFSRKQIISLKPVDLNELISRFARLLKRLIGEDIVVDTIFGEDRVTVLADSGQIEQVLMNLATNARDAMPHGGRLTIATGLVEMDDSYIRAHGYGASGTYALLSVTDTGTGMDGETQKRIYEPFFTTKETGRGTGLGLSMVYGSVKQHNGYINVYSEPGKGTTFKIYIPAFRSREAVEAHPAAPERHPAGGTETILLAEDDTALRKLAQIVLTGAGYTVIAAEDGDDAVLKFTEHKDAVELVLLDMIMPRKNGVEAYMEIRNIKPGVKALFMSGYTADRVRSEGMLEEGLELLLKPVSPRDLLSKVRDVFDR